MKLSLLLPSALALGAAAILCVAGTGEAYLFLGGSLDLTQRDFRVHNNFSDAEANDYIAPEPNFPGAVGAVRAICKGVAEWGSELRGDGTGDPSQIGGLGSGGANFDSTFQGLAPDPGGTNDNVFSEISGHGAGVLAFTELPISDGWRIRFYGAPYTWHDGPGPPPPIDNQQIDIQGVATHEYGHALGLDHTQINSGFTMDAGAGGNNLARRSIESDDIAGVQALYGVKAVTKPRILSYVLNAGQIEIVGTNFDPVNNDLWFTHAGGVGDGTPVVVAGLPSTQNGTRISANVPALAASGDLLVRVPGTTGAQLSNSHPFDVVLGECPQVVVYGTAKPNSSGQKVELVPSGVPSATYDSFLLSVFSGGTSSGTGILFYGSAQAAIPFMGGTLYSSGPYVRDSMFQFGFFGEALFPITSTPAMAGTTRYYQIWYADPGDAFGVGLSNAAAVTFCL